MNKARAHTLLGVCFLLLLLGTAAGLQNKGGKKDTNPPSRNMAAGVHYVGSRACRGCHAAIYQSFSQTGMGQSMTTANDSSLGDLPVPATVYDRDLGQYFEVSRKDGQLYQSQYALDDA